MLPDSHPAERCREIIAQLDAPPPKPPAPKPTPRPPTPVTAAPVYQPFDWAGFLRGIAAPLAFAAVVLLLAALYLNVH